MNNLPSETGIGAVSLTVSNLQRSLDFYQEVLGFQLHRREDQRAYLGSGNQDLLLLTELSTARQTRGTAGLYHFAVLLPSRRDLARILQHFANTGTRLQGYSDHSVSEALYLADPDGNGIEVYRDRPRSEWPFVGDELRMTTDPLDVQGLLGELQPGDSWTALPAGTHIGHIHLHVSDLAQAERFYRDVLGFELMVRYGRAASFLSAGGYHHHVGINTWAGQGVPPAPSDAVGLRWYTVDLPSSAALVGTRTRIEEAGWPLETTEAGFFVRDPSQNRILLRSVDNGAS